MEVRTGTQERGRVVNESMRWHLRVLYAESHAKTSEEWIRVWFEDQTRATMPEGWEE